MAHVVFTIGYERHMDASSLVDALRRAGIERLLDVRELPISRRSGFSKRALARVLEDHGLVYEHERALGNPKPYRDLYRSGDQARGEQLYRAHLRNGSGWAVQELATTLAEQRTCLLCFEGDHSECHRSVIVEELRRQIVNLRVEHL